MALLDPVDDHRTRMGRASSPPRPTRHPGVCLAGFVSVFLGAFLIVHLIFTALVQ